MRGVLILSTDETSRIVKKTSPYKLKWKYRYIGNMTSYLGKVPSIRGTKIYYNSSGYYFSLESLDDINYLIVKMMYIFELDVRKYNIIRFMSREYFMFECYPEEETIFKKKHDNDDEKTITIFHWLLGIKGNIMIRKFNCEEIETYSCGPYVLDYQKNDLSKKDIHEIFSSKSEMRNYGEFFTKNIENIREILSNHYNWFVQINNRLRILC